MSFTIPIETEDMRNGCSRKWVRHLQMPDSLNESAIAFYNAARAEIVQRLSLREQVLLAYLATWGVIAGLAFRR
jgi:hypothetical protein